MAPGQDGSYFIDAESAAEMVRLTEQDRLVTAAMGDLLGGVADRAGIARVLDLGCGPGGWAASLAAAYPEMAVEGMDISQTMVAHAGARAADRRLGNLRFRVGDLTRPLDYPDASFDLVNGRMIGFLPTAAWRSLMRECLRVVRPGGTVRLTEFEAPGTSTSAALEEVTELFARALSAAGQNFAPRGHRIGIAAVLRRCLQEAGAEDLAMQAHVIDYSSDTPVHRAFVEDWRAAFGLAEPFLIATGVTDAERFDALRRRMTAEMSAPEFSAVLFLLTVTGRRPAATRTTPTPTGPP